MSLVHKSYGRSLARLSLAAGLLLFGLGAVEAAENISGYVDSQGRVVFVNEATPTPANAAKSALSTSKVSANRKVIAKVSAPAESAADLAARMLGLTGPAETARAEYSEDSGTPAALDGPGNIQELVNEAAQRHQVDADLVHAIVRVESNYNPYAVSHKGARGLMQLIPATARRFGVTNSFDPRANLDGGIRYLKYLMGMFDGDLRLSLAAYNAGEMAVTRNGGVPPYRETQNYIRKISELYPMRAVAAAVIPPPVEPRIVRYVDASGVVHFSNTETF